VNIFLLEKQLILQEFFVFLVKFSIKKPSKIPIFFLSKIVDSFIFICYTQLVLKKRKGGNTMEKENKKQNNNIAVIAILALLLIAVLAFGIWAWSKYTSTLEGNGTATVAKWNFGTDTVIENLDLATTSGATKMDTVNNVATDRIAPGTSGSFSVVLNTTGTEVALSYDIILSNMQNKPTNLHFYSDAAFENEIDTTDGAKISGTIAQGDTGTKKTVTIYWKWAYETGTDATNIAKNDETDTTQGKAATENGVTFDLTITGTQINPAAAQAVTSK
jgi:hypothetical protein